MRKGNHVQCEWFSRFAAKINSRKRQISWAEILPLPNQQPVNSKQIVSLQGCRLLDDGTKGTRPNDKTQPSPLLSSASTTHTHTHTQSINFSNRPTSNKQYQSFATPQLHSQSSSNGYPFHLLRQDRRRLRLVWTTFASSFGTIAYMTQCPTSQMLLRREVCSPMHLWKGSDRECSDWTTLFMPYVPLGLLPSIQC
jgi:hypothetical protein